MAWLRVGITGVDGELSSILEPAHQRLRRPAAPGVRRRETVPRRSSRSTRQADLLAQFVTSAVSDSNIGGYLYIPPPADIARLEFEDMKLTSTAHLVGGDVVLPPGGVPLAYWDLQLVPTGPPNHAGVLSVRTGRILLPRGGHRRAGPFRQALRAHLGRAARQTATSASSSSTSTTGVSASTGWCSTPTRSGSRLDPGAGNPYLGRVGAHRASRSSGRTTSTSRDAAVVGTGSSPHPRWVRRRRRPSRRSSGPTELCACKASGTTCNADLLARVRLPRCPGRLQHRRAERLPRHGRRGVRLPPLGLARHHGRDPQRRRPTSASAATDTHDIDSRHAALGWDR